MTSTAAFIAPDASLASVVTSGQSSASAKDT